MRKPKLKKYLTQIAPVVLCATCLFDVPHLCAQTHSESRATIQLNPIVGDVQSERISGLSRSAADKLNANQAAAIEASVAKIQIDSKPKPELGITSFLRPEIESRIKTPSNGATSSQAGLAFEDRISLLKHNRTTNPTFNSLPVETTSYAKPVLTQKSIAQPVAILPQRPTDAYRARSMEAGFARPVAYRTVETSRPVAASRPVDVSRSVEAATNNGPPTVVLRPSALVANHENECVFEINEIESSNDVSLKVAIPDSVTMIEVVPNRDSNALRKFRIKMDQGNEAELSSQQPDLTLPFDKPQQPEPTSTIEPLPPARPVDADVAKAHQGYLKNPFFDQNSFSRPARKVARDTAPENDLEQAPDESISLTKEKEKKLLGVHGFLKRISHTSSSEETEQMAVHELAFEPEAQKEKSPKHTHSFASSTPVIAAQIVGPTEIDVNQTADFMVGIVNPLNATNRDLKIELDIPFGFKIVLLDQPADFNEKTGVLHWSVKEIKPGGKARLRYRVLALRPGNQVQRLAVRIKDDLVDSHEIWTLAKVNLDAVANELPFDGQPAEASVTNAISTDSKLDKLEVGANKPSIRPEPNAGVNKPEVDAYKPEVDAYKPDVNTNNSDDTSNEFPIKELPASLNFTQRLPFDSIGS